MLPDAPADQLQILQAGGVACWSEPVSIDSYEPGDPDPYPQFLDRRVYQGSSGRVYPMPFIERISREKKPRLWQAIHIENEWIRLMLLPEIGGRIHIGYDKKSDYDFFYRNNVIKPALVGLAGPWISGGVEFNWPQHHRPTTFLPVETAIERDDDGVVTVWHSSIDPLQGMRGSYGVRVRPDASLIEVDALLQNRADEPQTFLWWANVAARSHERYQSFFPTDVGFVADHARRAVTAFPRADRPYYGVDYPALVTPEQPDADRLDIYSNIPVPTSYMITDTVDDFFGGYDHTADAGFVHWADHTISPGKKQWTWGNGPIGHAWDRQLTDSDGPYVELMAGVYTDNQPDFSFIAPAETRRFSQFWYPINAIGPAHQATRDVAVSLAVDGGEVAIGVAVSREYPGARVHLSGPDGELGSWETDLAPGAPLTVRSAVPMGTAEHDLLLVVSTAGAELIRWQHRDPSIAPVVPWAATEPPLPAEVDSADELYLTGVHLAQYRHPTRSAVDYFAEALRRDPADHRAAIALGAWHHGRGEYAEAIAAFENAIGRMTRRNLNPNTGEASYRLGLTLERVGRLDAARERFAKAAWDAAWARPSHLAMARLDLRADRNLRALEVLEAARISDAPSAEATQLLVIALRRVGRSDEASALLSDALRRDSLDPALLSLAGALEVVDPQTTVTVALGLARVGEFAHALSLTDGLSESRYSGFANPIPLVHYLRALWFEALGDSAASVAERTSARAANSDFAFPYGLDDHDALRAALAADPSDARAQSLLGTWMLDAGRPADALSLLDAATVSGSEDAVAWRNRAIAIMAMGADADEADASLGRALELSVDDARLVFERDVLAMLRGVPAEERLASLAQYDRAVFERDDLTLHYLALLVDVGRDEEALEIVSTRWFQPFEGGEGQVIAVYDRAILAGARRVLDTDARRAVELLEQSIDAPDNLGEGRHPGVSTAERDVVLGDALARLGRLEDASAAWSRAVAGPGALAVEEGPVKPAEYWRGVAHLRLGNAEAADRVWMGLSAAADELETEKPRVDYFATSLPELLLFDTDTDANWRSRIATLRALAESGRSLSTSAVSV